HAQLGRRSLIQATARAETGFVHGGGHVLPLFQNGFEMAEATRVGILFGSDARDPFEDSLQVGRTEPRPFAEVGQRDGLVLTCLDLPAQPTYQFDNAVALVQPGLRRAWS